MTDVDYLADLSARARLVDRALDDCLPPEDAPPALIHRAMRYSVFAGGKRLRPVLCLASCEAAGGDPAEAMPAACAFELIHTYSLIHDDLPAMDNDDLRRGRPTSHRVFGEAIAILAGDALLTLGFGLLGACVRKWAPSRRGLLSLVEETAQACGTAGLIGGQVADLQSSGRITGLAELEAVHRAKTGALFRAAVRAGALIAGAGEDALGALTAFAEHFGLAFQITDDILDVTGDEEKLGKPVGSDIRNEKVTFVSLLGLDEARRRARNAVENAVSALDGFGREADFLRRTALFVLAREF